MTRATLIIVGISSALGFVALHWAMGQFAADDAETLNQSTAGLVTEDDLRSLKGRVELLRSEVEATQQKPHGSGFAAQRRAAHLAVRMAEQELQTALAVNRRHVDAIPPIDIRLRELRLDVARRRADVWDDPAFLASDTDVLQMQIDQVVDLLQDVLHDVENSPPVHRR